MENTNNLIKDKVMIDLDRYEVLIKTQELFQNRGDYYGYFTKYIYMRVLGTWEEREECVYYPEKVEKEILENAIIEKLKEKGERYKEDYYKLTDQYNNLCEKCAKLEEQLIKKKWWKR